MKSFRWIAVAAVLSLYTAGPVVTRAVAQEHATSKGAPEHHFSDQDRKNVQDWHNQHRDKPPVGFRQQDKLRAEDAAKIHEGAVLDADLRKRSHAVPADLLHRLPPPAKGHRYVVVGGQVCDVDSGWHISDVISINL